MTEKVYTRLRGHHLSTFAEQYFNGNTVQKYMSAVKALLEDFEDTKLKREIYKQEKEIRSKIDSFLYLLKTQPDLKVEIVEGRDSICEICSTEFDPASQCGENEEDESTLREYGLNVGKTYTIKEIIQRISEYKERTQFMHPRAKKIDNISKEAHRQAKEKLKKLGIRRI